MRPRLLVSTAVAQSARRRHIMTTASSSTSTTKEETITHNGRTYTIPTEMCSPFGSYPNPWQLTDADRAQYFCHPLVQSETPWIAMDLTDTVGQGRVQLATVEQYAAAQQAQQSHNDMSFDYLPADLRQRCLARQADQVNHYIGRYDENRIAMYSSALFVDDPSNSIQDYSGLRTLHMGLDVDGPAGTPVHAVCAGKVHQVGKNGALGDYGNVIVIQHEIPAAAAATGDDTTTTTTTTTPRIFYALYGHLDDATCQQWKVGDAVTAGAVVGRMGALHENGGWITPHVHFQLSVAPPVTHDLPGVVALTDRARALVEYPDPRYVLGPLY